MTKRPKKKLKRNTFFPKKSLKGKNNYKIYNYIQENGKIIERVHLHIPNKKLRELVVCLNFVGYIIETRFKKNTTMEIVSRDCPWDFTVKFDTGKSFNVEITSIADNNIQFEMNTREELDAIWKNRRLIPLRVLKKLNDSFPSYFVNAYIKKQIESGTTLDQIVKNPIFSRTRRIYVGAIVRPSKPFSEKLEDAIKSKEEKNHEGKSDTILIIDNRSSILYVDDAIIAINKIQDTIDIASFKEIWMYTGYCSDFDGGNALFTLISMKLARYSTIYT